MAAKFAIKEVKIHFCDKSGTKRTTALIIPCEKLGFRLQFVLIAIFTGRYFIYDYYHAEYRWLSVLWALIFENYFYSSKSRMKRSCFFSLKSSFEQEPGL